MSLSEWPEKFKADNRKQDRRFCLVEFEEPVECRRISANAVGFFDGSPRELLWIPKSQLEDADLFFEGKWYDEISMTVWIAKEKCLV